jgi:pyruvate kinase
VLPPPRALPPPPRARARARARRPAARRPQVIIVCSETGNSARLVAKYRPGCPVLCITASESVARQVNGLNRGVQCVVMGSMIGTDSVLARACDFAKERGWASSGDFIVALHGHIEGAPGTTNTLKVLAVP